MYHYTWLADNPVVKHLYSEEWGPAVTAIIHSWLACFLLIGLALLARAGLARARAAGGTAQFVPDTRLSLRNIWELAVGGLENLITSVLGKEDGRTFYALLAGLFIYVLTSNLMGLVPGFAAPTANIDTNMAMAIIILLVFNTVGIRRHGLVPYFKHLLGPIWWLAPLMLVVEALTLFVVRPISLSLRLSGNMFGDHMVFGIMSDLVPPLIPVLFLGLGAFVSFIQALVFTLLSSVYIALAAAHEEGEHGDDHGHGDGHSHAHAH